MARAAALLLTTLALTASPAWAQEATGLPSGDDVSLDDFLSGKVVSATKTAQSLREAPAIIEVITDRDIADRQYRSVAEALRTVPGFAVHYNYANYNVGVRGIHPGMRGGSRIIKVMIDNQPTALRTDSSNFLGPELIPMDMIKRIEIIRGPGSALYGADAYLGVINVVTKTGEDLSGGKLSLSGTSYAKGGGLGSLAFGQFGELFGQSYDFAMAGQLGYADRSGLSIAPSSPLRSTFDGQLTTDDLNRPRSLFGQLNAGDADSGVVNLSGSYQHLGSSGKFLDWSIEQRLLDSQNHLAIDNGFLRGSYQKAFSDNLMMSLGGAWVAGGPTDADRLDIGKPYYWQLRKSGYTGFDGTGEIRYGISERDSLTLGADYTQSEQRIQSTYNLFREAFGANQPGDVRLEGTDLGTRTFANAGVYAQGIYYPLDQLGLTGNARVDHHNVYGNVLNYRGGLVYLPADDLSLKLLYGTSFKAPAPLQLFSAPIALGDIIGNPDLKPERAQTLESEVAWAVNPHLIVSANGYYTQVQDQVQFVKDGANYQAKNLATAQTVGVEGSLRWQIDFLRGYLNGALQTTNGTGTATGPFVSADPRSELFPSATANVGVVAPLPWLPIDVYVEGRYVSSMKPSSSNFIRNGGTDYEIPAYAVVDAGLSARNLKLFDLPFDISGKITNLFDTPLTYPGFSGIDIPGERRSFQLLINQTF